MSNFNRCEADHEDPLGFIDAVVAEGAVLGSVESTEFAVRDNQSVLGSLLVASAEEGL